MELTIPVNLASNIYLHEGITSCGFHLYKPYLSLFSPEPSLGCYLNLCLLDCNPFTHINAFVLYYSLNLFFGYQGPLPIIKITAIFCLNAIV